MRGFRAEAGLHDPYIVENGGAVHGETPEGETWELPLGPDWTALKPQLQRLQAELGEPLRPLDELSEAEGQRLLGLGGEALRQAQRRCCSVPFVPPSAEGRRRLQALVQRMGLTVVQGNRMGHLLGPDISKGKALATLKRHLGAEQVKVFGLGGFPQRSAVARCGRYCCCGARARWPPSRVAFQDRCWTFPARGTPPMPLAGTRLCAGFFASRPSLALGSME